MSYRKTLKYIFIISFAIAILYPFVNSRFIFPPFTDLLIQNTENEAIRIGRHLSTFVVYGDNLIRKLEDFNPVVDKAKEDFNLEKIKVFSDKGEIVYSTNPEDIGKINEKQYFLDIVAKGEVYTKLVQKDTKTLEGRIVYADVIETYVPIMINGAFLGAFEIYYDITEKNQAMSSRAFRSSLISFSLFFGFFILITIVLFKAEDRTERIEGGKLSHLYQSPFFLLLFMVVAIFIAEFIVMFLLSALPPMSDMVQATLDASLLVMLSSPFLYFFLMRPLLLHIGEKEQAEAGLRKSHAALEHRVEERTSELAETNRQLTDDIDMRKRAEELLFQTKSDWEDTFNTITDMITIHDREFNIIRANKAAEEILGLPLLEKTNLKCFKFYHGTDNPPEKCVSCKSLETGDQTCCEVFETQLKKFIEIRAIPRYNNRNELIGLIHVVRDISERRRSEKAMRESEERYRSLVESTEDSVYLVDRNCNYLFMNKKHLSRLGLPEDMYMGQPFSKFHSPEETGLFAEKIKKVFETRAFVQNEYKSLKDGRYFLQTFSPVKDPDGDVTAVTITSKEITERKKMEEKLHLQSITDELTGLYNRRGFFALAEKQLKVANRMNSGLLLLYVDLDNLKQINDRHGHEEGDEALKEIATILKEVFRGADIIARLGGDEFVILALESPETNIETINARLTSHLDIYNTHANKDYSLSISLGVTRCNSEYPLTTDSLLSMADKLMYEQKRQKRLTG
jgi:diguanylate cyclase (GGDEF)-like protein/PAS domain S-box-containing protein